VPAYRPKLAYFFYPFLIGSLFLVFFAASNAYQLPILEIGGEDDAENNSITELNQDLKTRREAVDALKLQAEEYRGKVIAHRNEAFTLKNQLLILDAQIAKISVEIQTKEQEIEITKLDIRGIELRIEQLKKIIGRQKIIPRTAVNRPVLFFFIISVLSITHSINLKDSLVGGMLRLLLFSSVLFIVAAELKDKRQLKQISYSIAAAVILVTLDGAWQIFSGKDFLAGREPVLNLGLMRATASFKDSNLLGIYLSAFAPLLLGLALYGSTRFACSAWEKIFFRISAGFNITSR